MLKLEEAVKTAITLRRDNFSVPYLTAEARGWLVLLGYSVEPYSYGPDDEGWRVSW